MAKVACPLLLMWLATCCVLDCVGIMPPGRFLANLAKRGGWQVAVSVRNSTVAGLGVFVHDAHPEGTLLWRFDPDVGLSFGNSLADCMAIVESLGLTPAERTYVRTHGYGYKENSRAPSFWRLANDMGDFINRPTSFATNLNMRPAPEDGFDFSTARRPLVQQEELFEDYASYAPIPPFVAKCFSEELQTPRERCQGLQRSLPQAGFWHTYCQQHVLGNTTFGQMYAPYVDKALVKHYVAKLQIPGLSVPRFYAIVAPSKASKFSRPGFNRIVNRNNAGRRKSDLENQLRAAAKIIVQHSHAVVKLSHWSGMILVGGRNGWKAMKDAGSFLDETLLHTPHCRFSRTSRPVHTRDARAQRINEDCAMLVLTQLAQRFFHKKYRSPGEVQRLHSSVMRPRAKQSQYHFVPPSILIEEFLTIGTAYSSGLLEDNSTMNQRHNEYRFWSAHGTIIYIEVMCDHLSYTYVSRDFVELDITYPRKYKKCAGLYKPANWQQMVTIAQTLSRDIAALVRVDLYASDRDIYFSEFTFTPDGCRRDRSTPASAKQIVAYAMKSPRESWCLTSRVVECAIGTKPHQHRYQGKAASVP